MATSTPNLGLVKPANGEFTNTWDIPMNANSDKLDSSIGAIQTELAAAAGNETDLNARISGVVDNNGNPVASPEIVSARNSTVYGTSTLLSARLENIDVEIFTARQSVDTLIDLLASNLNSHKDNTVNTAPVGFLTSTGAVASVNGSLNTTFTVTSANATAGAVYSNNSQYFTVLSTISAGTTLTTVGTGSASGSGTLTLVSGTGDASITFSAFANASAVVADINGYRQVVSSQISTTVSGGAGTYYLYLQRNPSGQTILNGTTGTITTDTNSYLTILNDTTKNFAILGVQPGFLLQVTSVGSVNLGTYVISTVGYGGNPNSLQIVGQFDTTQSGLSYTIINPVAPTLGFTATAPALRYASVSNKTYIGQCVFDGTNITGITQYALQNHYEGFTQVTLTGGSVSLTIPHNLGYFPTRVQVYASQASAFAAPLDLLSSGAYVAIRADRTNVYITNLTNGLFYKDFSGTSQTSGYVFVTVDR